MGIKYDKAKSYVRLGGDVFAANDQKAYQFASVVGNHRTPIGPERHFDKMTGSTLGYWWHYHASGTRKNSRIGGHVFFI